MPGESKQLADRVVIAVFSGTGNTLLAVRAFSDELSTFGKDVSLVAMDSPTLFSLPEDASLGLAFPVACFSTYPTAWRFIDALPEGKGRGIFLLATMGGLAMGMDGPVRKVVERKGYTPLGSKFLIMPGNYGNKTIPVDQNAKRIETATRVVRRYAKALVDGSAAWGKGTPLLSAFWAWMAHTRSPWKGFYKIFPLTVDCNLCTGCGLCRDICPERNIAVDGGCAVIGNRCESCQRCIAFCPANAVAVPGKPAERYRGCTADDLLSLMR